MHRTRVPKTKQSLYLKKEFLDELTAEAKRLDRSLSYMVTKIWELSKAEIMRIQAPDFIKPKKESKESKGSKDPVIGPVED